ncbi:MAG: glycoside hydrolase family 104 protein [Pseudobacteriovorax sp.]|nr:glycoside hydrolase family 104 protein [Pseudobacteriovorax sp.]
MRNYLLLLGIMLFAISCGPQNEESNLDNAPSGHYLLIGNQDTFLKIRNEQSSGLKLASEKCTLYAGTYIPIQAAATTASGNHYIVNTRRMIPGCGFSKGYVYIPHVVASSSTGGTQQGRLGAFLSAIAWAEGTNDRYDIRFGGFRFSGYSRHPNLIYCSGGLCSDAAGRYQFLSTTWAGLRYPDFSPANQDKGAVRLMAGRGLSLQEVNGIRTYQQFSNAIYKINREWASLPGSPYGQPTKSMSALWQRYQSRL